MSKHLFGLEDLLESESKTIIDTNSRLYGVYEKFPFIINLLFKVPYYRGEFDDVTTDIGGFQSFCYTHYVQAPYTLWTTYSLYQKGYYLESLIMYRNLLETFIQMRYFEKFPEKLTDHITGKRRIQFKVMFDEFAEGFYKITYGEILSGAAHGMVMKDIFRVVRKSPTEARAVLGCEYNEDHATLIVNLLIPLLFGFINFFPKVFSKNTLKEDADLLTSLQNCKEWLERSMEEHKKINVRSKGWYEKFERIIKHI